MNDYGIPSDPITYGGGAGYIPFYTDLLKDNTALQLGQGSLANDFFKNLLDLRSNPAAGPLGLAAFGAFGGGAQNVAAGTGGKGLVDPYGGAFDRALGGLMSGIFSNPGSIYNPDNKGQVNTSKTTFNDPNQAPALTPTTAAQADNGAQSWLNMVMGRLTGGPVNLAAGGLIPASTKKATEHLKGFVQDAADVNDLADRMGKASKVIKATRDIAEHVPGGKIPPRTAAPGPGGVPGYAGGGKFYGFDTPQLAMDFARSIASATPEQLQALRDIAAGKVVLPSRAPGPVPTGTPGPDGTIVPPSVSAPNVPVGTFPPLPPDWHAPTPTPGRADGGGVTVGGQPHYIVDGQGNVKANITEDGQPEKVTGIPGGVEVTPMNPVRRAAYEAAKNWSHVLAGLDAQYPSATGAPGLATGGQYLFPSIPNSLVNTGPGDSGSNLLPTAGGPGVSRQDQIGQNYFKSTYDPTTGKFTLPSEATDATTANDVAGFSKLLGGALSSGNTAINVDALKSLNAGLVPDKLFSASELGTMSPSQQAGYYGLLQQALGVSPQDAQAMIKRFTPTSFTG